MASREAMIGGTVRRKVGAILGGVLFFLWPLPVRATVYTWKAEDGVLMMSNNPDDVPEDKRSSVQAFTSKPAPRPAPEEAENAPGGEPGGTAQLDAYQRGFEDGLQAAESRVAFAEGFSRGVLAAPPPLPAAPMAIEQPTAPTADYDESAALYPPYDAYAPYAAYAQYPYLLGYPFAVVGRVGPHRRFFPGSRVRGRHFGSRAAFGRMR